MCGRFVIARASSELIAEYDVEIVGDNLPEPSWNIAPTTRIPILLDAPPRGAGSRAARAQRRLEGARWGLVPRWAKAVGGGPPTFNARSETAAAKPTFRAAVATRRTAVPATGYYEWQKLPDGAKQPYFIHPEGLSLLMAGLYEWWRNPADDTAPWLLSTTILTRAATGELARVHDRMPVFLADDDLEWWLTPATTGDDGLVHEAAERGARLAETLRCDAVNPRVGNVRANDPSLIDPIDTA